MPELKIKLAARREVTEQAKTQALSTVNDGAQAITLSSSDPETTIEASAPYSPTKLSTSPSATHFSSLASQSEAETSNPSQSNQAFVA